MIPFYCAQNQLQNNAIDDYSRNILLKIKVIWKLYTYNVVDSMLKQLYATGKKMYTEIVEKAALRVSAYSGAHHGPTVVGMVRALSSVPDGDALLKHYYRYVYSIYPTKEGYPASLIQVAEFSDMIYVQ